jgi:hypothetical protein
MSNSKKKQYHKSEYNTNTNTWGTYEYNKSRSPFSLYFYMKKGFLFDDAVSELKKFQNNKNPAIIPCQLQYWLNKGYSDVEAIIKLQQWQTKDKSSSEKQQVMSHKNNLQIMSKAENLRKNSTSSITLSFLYEITTN